MSFLSKSLSNRGNPGAAMADRRIAPRVIPCPHCGDTGWARPAIDPEVAAIAAEERQHWKRLKAAKRQRRLKARRREGKWVVGVSYTRQLLSLLMRHGKLTEAESGMDGRAYSHSAKPRVSSARTTLT